MLAVVTPSVDLTDMVATNSTDSHRYPSIFSDNILFIHIRFCSSLLNPSCTENPAFTFSPPVVADREGCVVFTCEKCWHVVIRADGFNR